MAFDPDLLRPTAALAIAEGPVFLGRGLGAPGSRAGELVFNTAMTGYQEIMTDPSYAGQVVAFTFPHIGNVGCNSEDVESASPAALGMVTRAPVTDPSNFRAREHLGRWLERMGLFAVTGIDTRALTRLLREGGAKNAAIAHDPSGAIDVEGLKAMAKAAPDLVGADLAPEVTTAERHSWREGAWRLGAGFGAGAGDGPHVVAFDYGVKRNILRRFAELGCKLTVLPASASAEDALALDPDGVFLANGPGDPAATGIYAAPEIAKLIQSGKPVFGICLGSQMMALACGAKTEKMRFGHHGANHPVKDLTTGKVEITSQNHGFAVSDADLPPGLVVTHRSLFDGTVQGLRVEGKPVFSVQYHPEASPGPHDAHYLFRRFLDVIAGKDVFGEASDAQA